MKQFPVVRRFIEPLKFTPFHPQWYVYRDERKISKEVGKYANGRVLDIGAGQQKIRHYLNFSCHYISLDYYQTATEWYKTQPQIFGDGQALPIQAQSFDTVLLLDVLEHLPQTDNCLTGINHVLKPGGRLILHVPYLYPLHDVPYDFYRWTEYGLKELTERHNFHIEKLVSEGKPIETAALLFNLALSKTALNWLQRKNPLLLLIIFLPFIILFSNCTAWVIQFATKNDGFMPQGYFLVCNKTL